MDRVLQLRMSVTVDTIHTSGGKLEGKIGPQTGFRISCSHRLQAIALSTRAKASSSAHSNLKGVRADTGRLQMDWHPE